MTITADIYEVAVVIIALAFLALAIASIPAIIQLRKTVRAFEELSTESRKTVESINTVIKKTGEQAVELDDVVVKLRAVGLKATGLAELALDGIKSPLVTVLSLLMGIEFALKFLVRKDKEPTKEPTDEKSTGGEADV